MPLVIFVLFNLNKNQVQKQTVDGFMCRPIYWYNTFSSWSLEPLSYVNSHHLNYLEITQTRWMCEHTRPSQSAQTDFTLSVSSYKVFAMSN